MKSKIRSILIVISILIITPALLYLHFCVITDDCRSLSFDRESDLYVFENANIIPLSEDTILEKHSLIIKGDRIIQIEPTHSLKIPKRAKVIDASGKYLIPILSDMHVILDENALIPPNLPGISFHDELNELVNAGISEYDVLTIACTNSSELLEVIKERGTLEEGKVADIILLGSNPLEDISATRDICGVFTKKRWISEDDLKID